MQGDLVGTQKDGTSPLGNSSEGIEIGSSNHTVGGAEPGVANVIAFNSKEGALVNGAGSTGNRILGNSIFANGELGIDLGNDGSTANDKKDPDQGPNDLQNKPVLTSATTSGGTTTVKGKLNTIPNEAFELHFYSSPSGNEGKKFIGKKDVTTDSNGDATFTFTPGGAVAAGVKVTATATHVVEGNSSEFSAPKSVVAS